MASDIFSLGVIFCEILSGKPLNASVAVGPQLASFAGDAQTTSLLSKARFPFFVMFLQIVILAMIVLDAKRKRCRATDS
jgi:hypothetical protein